MARAANAKSGKLARNLYNTGQLGQVRVNPIKTIIYGNHACPICPKMVFGTGVQTGKKPRLREALKTVVI
jgi:hypothetical protein